LSSYSLSAPSAAPFIKRPTATSSTIYLEWDTIPKDKENGILLGYRVYYLRKDEVADYVNKMRSINVNINQRNVTITGLASFTIYFYGVAAFNSKGVDQSLASLATVKSVRTDEGGMIQLY